MLRRAASGPAQEVVSALVEWASARSDASAASALTGRKAPGLLRLSAILAPTAFALVPAASGNAEHRLRTEFFSYPYFVATSIDPSGRWSPGKTPPPILSNSPTPWQAGEGRDAAANHAGRTRPAAQRRQRFRALRPIAAVPRGAASNRPGDQCSPPHPMRYSDPQ